MYLLKPHPTRLSLVEITGDTLDMAVTGEVTMTYDSSYAFQNGNPFSPFSGIATGARVSRHGYCIFVLELMHLVFVYPTIRCLGMLEQPFLLSLSGNRIDHQIF